MIKYNVYIEDELAIPVEIDTSDKTEEYIVAWDKFLELLPFTPEVVEYTSFGHTPQLGDSWNGSSFISKDGSELQDISQYTSGYRYFALVIDGIVKWIYVLQDIDEEEGFIAALLSNPTFRSGE